MKGTICLATYWLLFIIAPTALILLVVPENWRLGAAIPIGLLLIVIGEHGFRKWKRRWHLQ
jgi:hypothetical protein